jgi:hypothetical protein
MLCLGRSDAPFPSNALNHPHRQKLRSPRSARVACSRPRTSLRKCHLLLPALLAPQAPLALALARADSPRVAIVDRRRRGVGPRHRLRHQALWLRCPCPFLTASTVSVCRAARAMLRWKTCVTNICSRCFRGMLHVFHTDVAYVAMVCTRMLKASVPNFICFLDVCWKYVYLDVAHVSHVCFKCFI